MGEDGETGTVVAVGSRRDLKGLRIGDTVMSFAFRGVTEANHQEYITILAYLESKISKGLKMPKAVTILSISRQLGYRVPFLHEGLGVRTAVADS